MGLDDLARKGIRQANRISRDYIPAVIEKFETQRVPDAAERSLTVPEAQQLAASLITPEDREKLDTGIESLSDGKYRMRETAGSREDGNLHVHDFVIEKSGPVARLFFVDPEHAMGKSKNRNTLGIPRRGDLRPQVNVLYSVEMTKGDPVPRIALLRYRGAVIPEDRKELNKPAAQLQMAESMLTTGELPDVLQGHENQITFRLDLRNEGEGHKVFAQARAARHVDDIEHMITSMTANKELPSHDPLEGQLRRFRAIMRTYFPKYLEGNNFVPLISDG
jgi:hypothetical protein